MSKRFRLFILEQVASCRGQGELMKEFRSFAELIAGLVAMARTQSHK